MTLSNIPKESAKILTIKYIDHIKTDDACKALDMPARTYFRKVDRAVSDFAFELKKIGFDEKKLYDTFKDEYWVLEVFDTYAKKNFQQVEKLNLLQLAMQTVKNNNFARI